MAVNRSGPDAPERADVFVSCAELSGDMHAGGLIRALGQKRPELVVDAIGGSHVAAAGANRLFDTVARATFGLRSFGRVFEMSAMLRQVRRRWEVSGPPRLVVCCDSWTLNKHVLALARRFGCRTMYYVSPQVWASREGRVARMAQLIDKVACILPFEEEWLRQRGIDATFVGHPLFDELPESPPAFDPERHFPNRPPRIALNFGSRRGTARANLGPLLEAARRVRRAHPQATFISPTVAATDAMVRERAGEWVEIVQGDFDGAVAGCDLAITVSGTATLHTAAHGVPMVFVYRAGRLLWNALGRHIIKTRTYGLVNLLHPSRQHVVPEFIPWFGDPEPVAEAALRLLDPPTLARTRAALAEVVDPLRHKGAGENAARIALQLLNGRADDRSE